MRGRFATLREYPVLFLSTALSGGCSSWAVRASVAAAAAAMPQRIGLRFMLPLLSMANNTSRQGVLSVEDHTRFSSLRELFETPGAT
jgi:predicted N-acetyltransferase YhbS